MCVCVCACVCATVYIVARNHFLFDDLHYNIYIGHCALMALRCLVLLFAPMKTKKLETNIPYIFKIVPVSVYTVHACITHRS